MTEKIPSLCVDLKSQTLPRDGSPEEINEIHFRCEDDRIWIDVNGMPKAALHISDDFTGQATLKVITLDDDCSCEQAFDLGPI